MIFILKVICKLSNAENYACHSKEVSELGHILGYSTATACEVREINLYEAFEDSLFDRQVATKIRAPSQIGEEEKVVLVLM